MLRKKADGWARLRRTLYTDTAEGWQLLLSHPIAVRIEGGAVISQIKKVFYRWLNSEGNPNSLLLAMALGVASFGILLSFLAFQSPIFEPSPRKPLVAEIELLDVPSDGSGDTAQPNPMSGAESSSQTAGAVASDQTSNQPASRATSVHQSNPIRAPKPVGEAKAKPAQAKAVAKEPIPAPKGLSEAKTKVSNEVKAADTVNQPVKPGKAEPAALPVIKLEAKPLVLKPSSEVAISAKPVATRSIAVQTKPTVPRLKTTLHKPAVAAKAAVKPAAKLEASKPAVKNPGKTQVAQKPQGPSNLTSKSLPTKPSAPTAAESPRVAISVRTETTKAGSSSSDITLTMPSHQQAGSPSIVKVEPLAEVIPDPSEQVLAQPAGVIPMIPREGCTRVRQVGLVGDMQATVVETIPVGSNDCMFP